MTARAGFEAELYDCWQRRDFLAWKECRAIYADYLEERGDPLYPMARAACTMSPCAVRTNGGPRVWLWRLYFTLSTNLVGSTRWARNRRMNGVPLLGFPRATLRCMEVKNGQARFTVTFKERTTQRWQRRHLGALNYTGSLVSAAFDIDLHPAGFARLFWPADYPREWEPAPEPTLFDKQEPSCPTSH